jgi:Synergist-CTERM protein sorting domain-containing protein
MGTNERPDMSTPPSDLGVEDMNDASEMSWGMDMNDAPEMSWGVDMGAADMSDASEDGPGEGCSSAGASAPAALLWLLAPLAARVRRRKGGDV